MKILWESISFLSTPFVRLSTRPKQNYHYVIAIAAIILFFVPHCITQNSTNTIDKLNDSYVDATHKKWMNVNNADDSITQSSDARVAISKRQSPTKISNSTSSSRIFSSSNYHRAIGAAPTHGYHEKSHLFTRDTSYRNSNSSSSKTTLPPSTPVKLVTMQGIEQQSSSASINNVLILIQTHKNIELNLVRDQFHQFSDMFGVKLANITIDFDTIDGKCVTLITSFIYNVSNLRNDVMHGMRRISFQFSFRLWMRRREKNYAICTQSIPFSSIYRCYSWAIRLFLHIERFPVSMETIRK